MYVCMYYLYDLYIWVMHACMYVRSVYMCMCVCYANLYHPIHLCTQSCTCTHIYYIHTWNTHTYIHTYISRMMCMLLGWNRGQQAREGTIHLYTCTFACTYVCEHVWYVYICVCVCEYEFLQIFYAYKCIQMLYIHTNLWRDVSIMYVYECHDVSYRSWFIMYICMQTRAFI
jgi:hypothetical protein